jgi:hypothetical protein
MKKYEYKKVKIRTESQFLELGREGWKLTAVEKGKFYFKRSLPNPFSTITNRGPK